MRKPCADIYFNGGYEILSDILALTMDQIVISDAVYNCDGNPPPDEYGISCYMELYYELNFNELYLEGDTIDPTWFYRQDGSGQGLLQGDGLYKDDIIRSVFMEAK